jgi:hypothetical protein
MIYVLMMHFLPEMKVFPSQGCHLDDFVNWIRGQFSAEDIVAYSIIMGAGSAEHK